MYESLSNSAVNPPVQGFLHRPSSPSGDGLVLTHGAGGNAQMVMLVSLAEAFAGAGFTVLRCNLPFRQKKPFGPPGPGNAARDREGLKNAVAAVRNLAPGRVFLGGQSYGGRQASMLFAEEPVADGMILLSYPLHPPGKPEQLRTQHLPNLHVPTLFVEGTRDPFATIEEIEDARKLIPAKTELLAVEGAGHDLGFKGKSKREELPAMVIAEFRRFFGIRAP
jgi:predicted alpha/beta-hydrolase family hydrolase